MNVRCYLPDFPCRCLVTITVCVSATALFIQPLRCFAHLVVISFIRDSTVGRFVFRVQVKWPRFLACPIVMLLCIHWLFVFALRKVFCRVPVYVFISCVLWIVGTGKGCFRGFLFGVFQEMCFVKWFLGDDDDPTLRGFSLLLENWASPLFIPWGLGNCEVFVFDDFPIFFFFRAGLFRSLHRFIWILCC